MFLVVNFFVQFQQQVVDGLKFADYGVESPVLAERVQDNDDNGCGPQNRLDGVCDFGHRVLFESLEVENGDDSEAEDEHETNPEYFRDSFEMSSFSPATFVNRRHSEKAIELGDGFMKVLIGRKYCGDFHVK